MFFRSPTDPVTRRDTIVHPHTPPHRKLQSVIIHSGLLVILLGIFGLATLQVHAYEAGVRRDSFVLSGPLPTPVLRFSPIGAHQLNVVAVLAHGYSADKEMMSAFAVDLAKQGITAYAFDFPGHGTSTTPYGGPQRNAAVKGLVQSLGEVVNYAVAHGPAPDTKLVLIGYSLGTIAVGEYALQHPQLSNLVATVLVAGILGEQPTTTNPRAMLVLSGQFDLPGINDISRTLIASGCAVPLAAVSQTYQCGATPSLERRRMVLPGLDHISIVTAGSTHAAVLSWLHTTVDSSIGSVPVSTDARLHWMLLGFLAAALAMLPLVSLGATALGFARRAASSPADQTTNTGQPSLAWWKPVLMLLGALGVGLALLHLYLPRDFFAPEPMPFTSLTQMVSADVAVYFLIVGVLLLFAMAAVPYLRRHITWPGRRQIWPQALVAIVAVLVLYFTLGGLSSFAWENLSLSPARLWRAGAYTLMVLPFMLSLRLLLGSIAFKRPWRAALLDFGATLLILASLVGAIVMNFWRLSYLGILLPVIAIVFLTFVGFSAWTRQVAKQPMPLLAMAQALMLGWLFAATLPLIA